MKALVMIKSVIAAKLMIASADLVRNVEKLSVKKRVELKKFLAIGEKKLNELLKEGDVAFKKYLNETLKNQKSTSYSLVERNLYELSDSILLSRVEKKLLHLTLLLHSSPVCEIASELYGEVEPRELTKLLMALLGCSNGELLTALSNESLLNKLNLIKIDSTFNWHLEGRLELGRDDLVHILERRDFTPQKLLSKFLKKSAKSTLSLSDFHKINEVTNLCKYLVKLQLQKNPSPTAIMICGHAGVGKTSLAMAIAKDCGLNWSEISLESDGHILPIHERFGNLYIASKLLGSNSLLVMDEASDLFGSQSDFKRSFADANKQLINQVLDNSCAPILFISNQKASQLDNAFLRRFKFVIDMPLPTKEVRSQILSKYMKGFGSEVKKKLIESEHVSPGLVKSYTEVIKEVYPRHGKNRDEAFIEHANTHLSAIGFKCLKDDDKQGVKPELDFDPNMMKLCGDLESVDQLIYAIKQEPSLRILISGPSGLGKTSLGEYLAHSLNVKRISKTAGELLHKHVGESEKSIEALFKEAKQTKSHIIQIDEVDSIALSRDDSPRWARSVTNSIFPTLDANKRSGIAFLATTNSDELDPAFTRRMDIVLRVEPPTPVQAITFIKQKMIEVGIDIKGIEDQYILERIKAQSITPAELEKTAKYMKFNGLGAMEDFINRLNLVGTPRVKNSIGFIRT